MTHRLDLTQRCPEFEYSIILTPSKIILNKHSLSAALLDVVVVDLVVVVVVEVVVVEVVVTEKIKL